MKAEQMKVGMRVRAYSGSLEYAGTIVRFDSDGASVQVDCAAEFMYFHRRQLVPLVKRKQMEWTGEWGYSHDFKQFVFIPYLGQPNPKTSPLTLVEKKQPKEKT